MTTACGVLVRGHTFLAYNMMAGGTDYEIDKKEEDHIK